MAFQCHRDQGIYLKQKQSHQGELNAITFANPKCKTCSLQCIIFNVCREVWSFKDSTNSLDTSAAA